VRRGAPAEFKERAVQLAVASEPSMAQTARDLGVNETTLHTWGNSTRLRVRTRPFMTHPCRRP
jgi:transposase-like protein